MSEGADRSQILQGGAAICGQGALTAWKQMVMPPISQKSSALLLPHTDDFHEAAMHTWLATRVKIFLSVGSRVIFCVLRAFLNQ